MQTQNKCEVNPMLLTVATCTFSYTSKSSVCFTVLYACKKMTLKHMPLVVEGNPTSTLTANATFGEILLTLKSCIVTVLLHATHIGHTQDRNKGSIGTSESMLGRHLSIRE